MSGLLGIKAVQVIAGETLMLMVMKDVPIMSVDLGIIAIRHCHAMVVDQALSTIKVLTLLGGLCHAVDFSQMWQVKKTCPSLEDLSCIGR